MNQTNLKTAIVFFARSAENESQHKALLPSVQNTQFLKLLRQSVHQTLNKTAYPVIDYTEELQRGETFGERMANAFADTFAKGYEQVILVGSDCPELSEADIHQAVKSFETNDLVLGPDLRGGLYLVGVKRLAFDFEKLANLDWQDPKLIKSMQAYAKSFQVVWLEAKFDLNLKHEVQFYKRSSKSLKKLIKLLQVFSTPHKKEKQHFFSAPIQLSYLRGPPVSFA